MSARLWTVQLVLKDHGPDVDISKKYSVIEFEDAAPQNAIITLNAARGRFITTGTIIQKWDRIWINVVDQNGVETINSVVHVKSLQKMRQKGKGLQLKLFCPHQSSNLIKQTIAKPNRRSSGRDAMNDIISQMNTNRAANDPSIETTTPFNPTLKLGNRLDDASSNDYIFESVKAETAINEIIEREGNPVELGGSFEFMFFRFVSKYDGNDEAELDVVELQVFEQGFMTSDGNDFTNIAQVTLTKPTLLSEERANTLGLDSDLETEKGTNLIAIGDRFSGSYPVEYMKYMGAKAVFDGARLWESGREYFEGNLVTFNNTDGDPNTFECIQDNTADGTNDPTNNSFWFQRFFLPSIVIPWSIGLAATENEIWKHNEIGYKVLQSHTTTTANEPPNTEFWVRVSWPPTVDYSPLTKDKVQYWINALGGAQHASTNNRRTAIITPDVVVRDQDHPRTWVDITISDPALIPSELLKNGNPFDTFRALAMNPSDGGSQANGLWSQDTFGTGAGNDPNGVAYAGNIVEYIDSEGDSGNGVWEVAPLGPNGATILERNQEIYDFYDGLSWISDPNDNSPGFWLKGAYFIQGGLSVFIVDAQFECAHPVAWDGTNNRINMGNSQILPDDTDTTGTSGIFVVTNTNEVGTEITIRERAAGFNFAFPWPRTGNGEPYQVGSEPTIGEKIALEQFDMENMHLTHERKREWFGPQVEDYFPIQGFEFFEKFEHLSALVAGGLALDGDYPMGLWIQDRRDNIWIMDYIHQHNGATTGQTASFGKRKVFRAVPGLSGFIPAQEPEVLDIVDPRSIVRGGIFTKDSYDQQNRFITQNRFLLATDLKLSLDGFRMTKPIVATNVDEPNAKPDRNIEPQKLIYEKIVSYSQLKNYVLAMSQILGFQTDRYTLVTPGRGNVKFGDPVKYTDAEAISESLTDTSGTFPNTVKATATNILYSISKTPDGPGGFTRTLELTTRLYPE